jgi:phosphate transport system substrate-binding protein
MRKISSFLLFSVLLASLCVHAQQGGNIEVRGADTLILFGQKVNQLHQRRQPLVTVRVNGGGLQSAIPLLLQGKIQIAQSHGELHAESARDLLAVPVGVEGIVIYVNQSNPINELSVTQVRAIYSGEILNWKQLGGPDERIVLYGGESTSSISPYFLDFILHGDNSFSYQGKSSTKELLDAVADSRSAIGFAAFGYAPRVKALRIRSGPSSPAIEPTIANIRALEYPITRRIYWYLARRPQGPLKDLMQWIFSSEGQLVVEGVGFQPLPPEQRTTALHKLGLDQGPGARAAN